MKKDDILFDAMVIAIEQMSHLIDFGEDELHNAERTKADGTRNKEVDKAHSAILAAQRLLHDIVAEIDECMDAPIEGTTAEVAEATANAH